MQGGENTQPKKSDEWYTPAKYIEATREVMGAIDLDPASCALANETVKATQYYSKQDNGLKRPWHGRVWLNPPFSPVNGKSGQGTWAHYLLAQYEEGNVEQAILLVTANTEVGWFQPLFSHLICFVHKRLNYQTPTPDNFMATHQSRFGTCFVYLGVNEERFIEVFSKFGHVVRSASKPQPKIQPALWGLLEVKAKSGQPSHQVSA